MGRAATFGLSWSVALRLGRVSNLPTVWTNVLAGIVLTGAALSAWPVFVILVALSLFYVAGMFLNDAFDRDFDRKFRPARPIPSGAVRASVVFGIGFGLLALGFALLVALALTQRVQGDAWRAPAAGVVLALMIVLYDSWHKSNPLSPLLMALCRMLVYLIAACAFAAVIPDRLFVAALTAVAYLIGLTYAAKQETLHRVENLWPLLFLGVPVVYGLPIAARSIVGFLVYALFVAVVGRAVWLLMRRAGANVPGAMVLLIAGISLLDAVFIAGQGQGVLAGIAVLGFALTLLSQRYIAGT
jgi:4-hydroxybenzoate polyprenyltransferase